jgi:4a-hydroxytetrahydrobiopterin dehydratase
METDLDLQVLNQDQIEKKLKEVPGWKYANDKISKEFLFPSFKDALALINNLQPFSDRIDHHPDIHIYYKKIVFDLQRFSVDGKVTERDFGVAKEIERLYALKNYKL